MGIEDTGKVAIGSIVEVPEQTLARWQSVVDVMAELLQVPSAIITRVEFPFIEVLRAARVEGNPYDAGIRVGMAGHYCETVIRENRRLVVNHAPTDPLWSEAPEIEYGMLAYLGYPLHWPQGEVFGTICVLDNRKNEFGRRYDAVLLEFRDLIESQLALLTLVRELEAKNGALERSIAEVKVLRGILPVCGHCKRIRDDAGYWRQLEDYISAHSEAVFSHGLCPQCLPVYFPDESDED
ncbi:MAG: GAF domain-containing protein [Polyangiaceae bacterium]|nr:GAF domain-containing protein [Polyangiaceae bacterium]